MLPKYPKHKRMKEKRLQDVKHLHAIRDLPCLVCGSDRSDMSRASHHLMHGTTRGFGLKAPDSAVIPLCTPCHTSLHDCGDETAYLEAHGVKDAPGVAKALYAVTGSYEAMLNALRRN